MENLIIEGTKATPQVNFNFEQKEMKISGQSYPENSFSFYKPILEWIEQFISMGNVENSQFIIDIKYLNTSSTKSFMNIFELLEDAAAEGRIVSVKWLYDTDNDSIREVAEEFKEDLTIPFEIIER